MTFRVRTRLLNRFGCRLHPSARIEMGATLIGRNLVGGDGAYVNTGVLIDAANATVTIGNAVHIGPRAVLLTDTHDLGPVEQRAGANQSVPLTIGDGVWIGAAAVLLPGAVIAPGCVIAAGAIVTGDTEPNGLYAGVPARRVRDLTNSRAL
jgi:maltose O-acetyltransferase